MLLFYKAKYFACFLYFELKKRVIYGPHNDYFLHSSQKAMAEATATLSESTP